MAGLAALMTRKKRDRRRELEMKGHANLDSASIAELSGKEAQQALQSKAAQETIKKMLIGKELLHQKSKSQSFDAMSQMSYNDNEDDNTKGGFSNAYSPIYVGLILMCIGIVITFVGLGEKGFKTLQLKLIGPIMCLVGFTSITVKIVHCTFPQLFHYPGFLKRRKSESEKERSSLVEKGEGDGAKVVRGRKPHRQPSTTEEPSPRVTLQSSKKVNRPRSTIPNYIEDSSDDSDDFNAAGKAKTRVTKMSPSNSEPPIVTQPQKSTKDIISPLPSKNTDKGKDNKNSNGTSSQPPVTSATTTAITPTTTKAIDNSGGNGGDDSKKSELVLSPRGLFL